MDAELHLITFLALNKWQIYLLFSFFFLSHIIVLKGHCPYGAPYIRICIYVDNCRGNGFWLQRGPA
jgi:hypothetical protein